MKVYISGKIDEEVICETTRQKFARAEKKLKTDGYEVFNPCDQNWQAHLKARYEKDRKTYQPYTDGSMPDYYSYCLLRSLMALSVKDAIYMLPDFLQGKAAKAEYAFAIATGKLMIYDDELYENGILRP